MQIQRWLRNTNLNGASTAYHASENDYAQSASSVSYVTVNEYAEIKDCAASVGKKLRSNTKVKLSNIDDSLTKKQEKSTSIFG